MCILCKSAICPSKCPNYEPLFRNRKPIECSICGEIIAEDAPYYLANGFPYCECCLRYLEGEALVRICESSFEKGLEKLGFSYSRRE